MRSLCLLLATALAAPAAAAPRIVVWLPDGSAVAPGQVARAFAGTEAPLVLDPATVAARFPPSPAAQARAAKEARADALLGEAEQAFVETRFDAAAARLAECRALLEELPPTVRSHAAWVRARLLEGRIALAQKKSDVAAAAFAAAAAAAPAAQLDEAEYPPEVCQAYRAARERALAEPARRVTVRSDPAGAEVEVNGRLWGRTPATVKLPRGRCRLTVSRPGYQPYAAPCGAAAAVEARLVPADRAVLRDQLRERLTADPRWFVEPLFLDALATEVGARWVLALERGRGEELEARLYWALRHTFRPLVPARYGAAQIAELGAAVREVIAAAEGLEVTMIDPLTRAPMVNARAGDPDAIARAVAFVRPRGRARWERIELEAKPRGSFTRAVPRKLLGAPGTALDLEYYVEGLDAEGDVRSRAGEPARPLVFHRGALPVAGAHAGPAPPAWHTRWWFWTAVGAVVAGAALGTYFAVRPGDVAVNFGAPP